MEIKCSFQESDEKTFGRNEIIGLIDKSGEFQKEHYPDAKTINKNDLMPVFLFLKTNYRQKRLIDNLISELEIPKDLMHRKLKSLSESELIKVLIIKAVTKDYRTIILDSIDTSLTWRDYHNLINSLKSHASDIGKTIIISTNKGNNILDCNRYIVTDNSRIVYKGKELSQLPVETDSGEFTTLANEKGAGINYYKDINDLLKAVYRSLK